MTSPTIAIVGGGIAGLAAALSLERAGFTPTVYETASALAPLGVGINLLPQAVRELTELGLLDNVLGLGVAIDDLAYLTKRGVPIWREARGLAAGYRWPQIAVHRGRLQLMLLDHVRARLGEDAVRVDRTLSTFSVSDRGVRATFVDRQSGSVVEEIHVDLLLAADGIHSTVRRMFYPDEGPPTWNGRILWRSTTRTGKMLGGRQMLWAGHARQKFVAYPIEYREDTGETLLNWICELQTGPDRALSQEDWNRRGDRADFLPRFEDWRWAGVDVPAVVKASGDIFEFPMVDRDPLPRWTFRRVTLLGDAAHPMYPMGSNGATQAVIDARALAYHLATASSLDEALVRYEAERLPATTRIIEMNRREGPDRVMELAERRAPAPHDDLDALFPMTEREAIAAEYMKVAGFDPASLNAKPSYTPATSSRR